jgi:hypothetical protein
MIEDNSIHAVPDDSPEVFRLKKRILEAEGSCHPSPLFGQGRGFLERCNPKPSEKRSFGQAFMSAVWRRVGSILQPVRNQRRERRQDPDDGMAVQHLWGDVQHRTAACR